MLLPKYWQDFLYLHPDFAKFVFSNTFCKISIIQYQYWFTSSDVVVVNELQAMVAGGGFFLTSYRQGYDISIPVFNYLTRSEELYSSAYTRSLISVTP